MRISVGKGGYPFVTPNYSIVLVDLCGSPLPCDFGGAWCSSGCEYFFLVES